MSDIKVVTDSSAVLGAVLIRLRTTKGMKQSELAAAMGVGSSTWSRIEKGESRLSIDQLKKVANILDETPASILEMAEIGEQESTRQGVAVNDGLSITGMAIAGTATGTAIAGLAGAALTGSVVAVAPLIHLCGTRLVPLICKSIDKYKSRKSCKAKED